MKTKYFKEASLSDDGKKKLQIFAGISVQTAEKLIGWFEQQTMYPRMDYHDRFQLAQITGESGEIVQKCSSILKLFIDRIIDKNENVNDFYEDIKSANLVPSEIGYKTLDVIFAKMPDLIAKFRILRRQRVTESSGIATLTYCSSCSILKPILRKRFEYGVDKINEYLPEHIGYCVMAMIELEKSNDQKFSFQMNSDDFNRFISELLSLQAEMRQLENVSEEMSKKLIKGEASEKN